MKKLFALLLAVILVVSIAPTAFAENATPNTTLLTTEVPGATYILNIPSDQTIDFGRESTGIGNVTVTNGQYFSEGKNLAVTINYEPFASESVTTKIPYKLLAVHSSDAGGSSAYATVELATGSTLSFSGLSNGTIRENAAVNFVLNGQTANRYMTGLSVKVDSTDWGKALAGTYSSKIVFTAAVVVE